MTCLINLLRVQSNSLCTLVQEMSLSQPPETAELESSFRRRFRYTNRSCLSILNGHFLVTIPCRMEPTSKRPAMSLVVQLLQGAAVIGAFIFGYLKLSAAERISAHSLIKRVAVLVAMALLVAASLLEDGPPSGKEICGCWSIIWNMKFTISIHLPDGVLGQAPSTSEDDPADPVLPGRGGV